MFRGRTLILILCAGVLAVVAAIMANNWLEQQSRPVAVEQTVEKVETVTLYSANTPIAYGQEVEAKHLKQIEMPVAIAPEGAARSEDQLIGQIAQSEIVEGEILMQAKFSDDVGGSTLAALIEPTKRALTVRVNDVVGVAGFLLPGNRIDVLASRVQNKRAYTRTLLEDLKVLAVDQIASTNDKDPVIVRAVTLEVTPTQAEIIVKARSEGPIQLTLRNPVDLAKKPAPRRATSRPVSSSVTIIRGTSVQSSKVNL